MNKWMDGWTDRWMDGQMVEGYVKKVVQGERSNLEGSLLEKAVDFRLYSALNSSKGERDKCLLLNQTF